MKRYTTLAIAAALLGGLLAQAQEAEELRIYINPGHGAWTSSDRPLSILREVDGQLTVVNPHTLASSEPNTPDTTAFYETSTNLRKCYALVDRLESYGLKIDRTLNQDNPNKYRVGAALDMRNNIVMTHVMAGPYPHDPSIANVCSRSLSEIAREAEENNFDMFISIHSNASSKDATTTNYIAFLYRGTQGEGGDRSPGSRDMALSCWPYAFGVAHQPWTARKTAEDCVLGDVSFYHEEITSMGYSGYLGALRHGVPGFLVEGYFHTYLPSRHRAMNFDTDRIEGIQYARGIADYFELQKESTGEIYGVIRDKHQKFTHDWYKPQANTSDIYLPLNGVTVTLSRDGQAVRTVTTDNHYNGAFVFFDLEPGEYTLSFSHPDYKDADIDQPTTITVEAATTAYPEIFLESVNFHGDGNEISDYPNELAGTPAGYTDEFVFTQSYADKMPEEFADIDGLDVRRTLLRDDLAYILATDADGLPRLLIYDTATGTTLRELGTEGTEGDTMPLSDIALTADGILLGTNAGSLDVYDEGPANVKIYRWENNEDDNLPDGDPETFIEMSHAGNWNNSEFGQSMAFSGTLADGVMLITNKSAASSSVRVEAVYISDGEHAGHSHMKLEAAEGEYNAETMGRWQISIAPDNSSNFILTSTGKAPAEFTINREAGGVPRLVATLPDGLIAGQAYGAGFVNYGGEALMVAPETDADGLCTSLRLLNISGSLAQAELLATTNSTLSGAIAPGTAAASVSVARDASGRYQWSALNLLATDRSGSIARLTTRGAEQPKRRANFAYGLSASQSNGDAVLTFSATGDATAATAILTNKIDPDDVRTYDLGAVSAGANSCTIDASALADGAEYNWAVELRSAPVGQSGLYFASGYNPAKKSNSRGGVVVITDPEQPSFGKTIAAYGYAQGIEVWRPDLTAQGVYHKDAPTMAVNLNSLYRGAQIDGKAVFTDWSDAGAGYWVFDPEAPETLTNMLQGTNDGKGGIALDGKNIGGSATGLSFARRDDGTLSMYSFVEDYPTTNAGNYLVRYDLADDLSIAKAPDFVWDSKAPFNSQTLFSSKNVELAATDHGLWLCQIRGAGQNNSDSPSLVLVGADGSVKFNSGAFDYLISGSGGGFALNADCSLLAISDPANIGISIFSVDWLDEEEPLLNRLYTIPSTANANEHCQMAFDPADNLHVYTRGAGYQMYTLKNASPVCSVPAPSASLITGAASGLQSVALASGEYRLYPNPATSQATLRAPEAISSISLYTAAGRPVDVRADISGTSATLHVGHLPQGIYLLQVDGRTLRMVKR